MRKSIWLIFILTFFISINSPSILSQLGENNPSNFVGEYFLDSGKSVTVMDKTVGIGTVRSNGEVYVYIDSYGRYIYPSNGFIEYEGLIVEPLETFYDSTDPKGHSASIAVYSTIIEEIREPDQIDEDSWLFDVDEEIELFDKKIKLLDVYDDGAITVQVGKPTVIIFSGRSDNVFDPDSDASFGASFITIKNEESFYTPIRSERAAQLEISQGFAIAGSESVPAETVEEPSYKGHPIEDVESPVVRCDGCLDERNNCIDFGIRKLMDNSDFYCGLDTSWHLQEEDNELCQNNYECKSNQCSNGYCINLQEQLRETQNLLQKIWNWLSNLFS